MTKRIVCGVVVFSILALIAAGCAAAYPAPQAMVVTAPAEMVVATRAPGEPTPLPSPLPSYSGVGDQAVVEHIIVRNASLDLVVPDTEAALDEVNDVVDELGGYVVESNVYQYGEGKRASVRLRVPAENLDVALERFRSLATEVLRENTSAQDMTDEYVDLQSYLKNREAVQKRLLGYLEEAEDTETALAIDRELRQIEAEIDRTKGRIQYLEQSAAMSMVTLQLIPDELAQPIEVGGWRPEGTLRDAFQTLIHVLQFLVDAVIFIVVLVIPVAAVVAAPFAGLFFLVRAVVRRRRARRAGQV